MAMVTLEVQMADRGFDITWVRQAEIPEADTTGEGVGPARPVEDVLLDTLRILPDEPLHVVDLAKVAGPGFEETLRGVLNLVGRDQLEIVQRDEVAGDHLVRLTAQGRVAGAGG